MRMKLHDLFESTLVEIVQNPSVWNSWAQSEAAAQIRVGFEAELIVPLTEALDDPEPEPDYSDDPPAIDIEEVVDFYSSTDFGMSRREANELRERMQSDYNTYLEERVDLAFEEHGDQLIRNLAAEQEVPDEDLQVGSDIYDQLSDDVRDQLREQAHAEIDERDWLRHTGIHHMSDVESEYNVTWPIWEMPTPGESLKQIQEVADHVQRALNMHVYASTSYHTAPRVAKAWVLEPDSSISVPDTHAQAGLELITPSPPPPLPESLQYLDKVFAWAKNYGCETNRSTGFHMNMSLPPEIHANLDPVKLILLLGDEKILRDFGRSASTYAQSAFAAIQNHVKTTEKFPVDKALEALRAGLTKLATTIMSMPFMGKYTSVHVKSGYVEFRHAGGDYLDRLPEIKMTLLRMAYTLSVAADAQQAKTDYARKLYVLLSGARKPRNVDAAINLFSLYSAGVIDAQKLKQSLQQIKLDAPV